MEEIEQLGAELGRLTDEASRKAFLDRAPQLLQQTVVEQLAEAVRRLVRVDVPLALGLAEAALIIARELQDKVALARGSRAKANALWFMGQCKEAVDLFQEAARLFEETGNRSEVGRTLSSSIQSLALLGDYEGAFAAAGKARDIFNELGESLRVARLEINVANIHHRQSHFAEALSAYERAYQQLLPHKDMEGIGVALHNMAVCLIALDDFRRALETYRRVQDFCEQNEMPLLVAQADYNIAYLYSLRGEYTQALKFLRAARETYQKNGDRYHLALCDLDQSEIYLELSLIGEAAEISQKSFEQFKELGTSYEAAKSLANLAIAVGKQGDSSRSLALFAEAKKMVVGEKNQVWPPLLDLYQAVLLFEEGKLDDAQRLCISALNFFRSTPMPSKQALCELLLARLALRNHKLQEAFLHCENALGLIAAIETPTLSYQAHFIMGQVQEALGEQHKAYDFYQTARADLETLRSSLQEDELKIGFMKNKVEVYERLVYLCLHRDTTQASMEEAFSYVEEAKSRSLRDLILGRTEPPPLAESDESETDRRIRDLRKELNWFYRRIEREQLSQDGAPAELIALLQSRAKSLEQELVRELRESPATGWTGKILRESATVTMQQIHDSLDSETALVEYFGVSEQIFATVVTTKGLTCVPLASVSQVTDKLRMLQFQMSKFRLGNDYATQFQTSLLRAARGHLQAIHEDIWAPLRPLLNISRLVIVPYGPLHSLPFHALFDGQQFLIDQYTVCYAPSASIYALCHREQAPLSGPSLILGVEDSKIPFVRQEVEAIASVVPEPKVLLGPDATEQALRENGRSSRLIHIATHGYFRQDSPMFSAIRLADSYLNLYDLYHMNLPVELLTLSACVTGLNVIAEGDELLGLARGLLYAGARSLLLSLWDVDDRSTSEFMESFYSRMLHQSNKAEALRGAMQEMRERYPHPYHWAPFKLIGKAFN